MSIGIPIALPRYITAVITAVATSPARIALPQSIATSF